MVRIFSIDFLFRHGLHSALVYFRQEGGANYTVRCLDAEMETVFAGGLLVLSPSGVIESRICGPQRLAEAFALSTKTAIDRHLNGERGFSAASKIFNRKGA